MAKDMPTGKLGRALAGGQTAARVGGRVLSYYAKRPFLSGEERHRARETLSREGARELFKGLSLLKGTALKMAQQLSLEMDLLPEAACRELAKAYHRVPPINRALARRVVQDGLGGPLEVLFADFDLEAHAAASLGQVHRAVGSGGRPLAVKIQYPGIARTIDTDVTLLGQLLKPMVKRDHLTPALAEVAARLREEVDYRQEADHLVRFAKALKLEGVRVPEVVPALSSATVLTTGFMPGLPLDLWLQEGPSQADRDRVARGLQSIFVSGLYDMGLLHADPNPGNFIIAEDLTIGLVDFGCIKPLTPPFVEAYRRLMRSAARNRQGAHFGHMRAMGVFSPDTNAEALGELEEICNDFSAWYSQLFAEPLFDFGRHPEFIPRGKRIMARLQRFRQHLEVQADFIFPDRTRYGLLRLFEQMGARVAFRNAYEW